MFSKYIVELKNRIFFLGFSWFTTVFTCYKYKETLLYLLVKANKELFDKNSFYFITTNLTEMFSVYIKICCFVSNQFLFMYLLYHFLVFISPGLYYTEYKNLSTYISLSICFNLTSVFLFNSIFLPYIWSFFLSYIETSLNERINVFFEVQITDYLMFYVKFYWIFLFLSQLFLLFFISLLLISDKVNTIKTTRKIFYSLFLIFSTLITPPDIISQLILTFFFILVYELIIQIALCETSIKFKMFK